MAAGDERYLLPRDKGPVKAYIRNVVDSRRHLVGLFMPLALVVVVAMLSPATYVQVYAAPVLMAVLVVFAAEGFFIGRSTVIRATREPSRYVPLLDWSSNTQAPPRPSRKTACCREAAVSRTTTSAAESRPMVTGRDPSKYRSEPAGRTWSVSILAAKVGVPSMPRIIAEANAARYKISETVRTVR